MERRRGPGRRRSDQRRSAEEGEMSDEQFEFLMAIDEYKRVNNRPFPTWTEVLEVIKHLGYRKVAPVAEHIDRIKDEPSDT
jgi:predicted transcriptional regulator